MDRVRNFFGYNSNDTRFYGGHESPEYIVEEKREDYEIRSYEPTKWVGCSKTSANKEKPSNSQFWNLFNYIRGENTENQSIAMTVPVTNIIQKDSCESFMNFFVPRQFHENVPTPKNPDLIVRDMDGYRAYVRTFGGYASDRTLAEKEAAKLKASLERDGLQGTFRDDIYYLAVYQSPFRLIGRRNEIMIPIVEEVREE